MRIIEIEGMDGSGKSTVARELAREFGVELACFPHPETVGGQVSRGWLSGGWRLDNPEWNAYAHQAVQVGSRLEWLARTPLGKLVVADRWRLSAYVYGTLDGLRHDVLTALTRTLPFASVGILLDVSVERSLERRKQTCDYESVENRKRVRELYREFGKHFHVVDADQPLERVLEDCREHVRAYVDLWAAREG